MKKALYITKVIAGKAYHQKMEMDAPQVHDLIHIPGIDLIPGGNERDLNRKSGPQCPHCGLSKSDFEKTGRLGCPRCYETFGRALQPLLKKIHRGGKHYGKVPARHMESDILAERLFLLQDRLQKSISAEDYEEAACLRDNIEALKSMQIDLDEPQGNDSRKQQGD